MAGRDARTNLNPSLALTFLIVAVTGVMLFFHIGGGKVHGLHEWMSVVFLILSIIHLYLNWKLLWAYLERGPFKISLVVVLLISVALLLTGENNKGHGPDGRAGADHAGYLDSAHRK